MSASRKYLWPVCIAAFFVFFVYTFACFVRVLIYKKEDFQIVFIEKNKAETSIISQ
jgi:hypothetical protein